MADETRRLGSEAVRRAMGPDRRISPETVRGWDLDMDDTRALSAQSLTQHLNASGAASVGNPDVPALMADLGRRARAAARRVALASAADKNAALRAMAACIRTRSDAILAANAADLADAKAKGQSGAFIDRL